MILVLVFQMLCSTIAETNNKQLQEIALIRRAYLDVTGLIPTTEEVDWYVVYNNNGYEMAVDHLLKKYPTTYTKAQLMSEVYIQQPPMMIPVDTLRRSLLYIVGIKVEGQVADTAYTQGKQRLIQFALQSTDSTSDAIDYMCEAMMSRTTSVVEANMLNRRFNDICTISSDTQCAWMLLVEDIMKLPGVSTK